MTLTFIDELSIHGRSVSLILFIMRLVLKMQHRPTCPGSPPSGQSLISRSADQLLPVEEPYSGDTGSMSADITLQRVP
jgi:hypothetical protein